jgi:excisionase family DNA binding protein
LSNPSEAADELLTPAAAAAILYVDPKTVTRWAQVGKIASIRTAGGHRRFWKSDVLALLSGPLHHHHQGADPEAEPAWSPGTEAAESVAAAVVAEAVAIALEAEAEAAAEAVLATAAAVAAAAEKAAQAAARARAARAFAAAEAARVVAGEAVRTAAWMQSRADGAATQIAAAAERAASIVMASQTGSPEPEATLAAVRDAVASTVFAAGATAQETARAAASVAQAVAAAAAQVATIAALLDVECESEVAAAAQEVKDLTTLTARRAAFEARAKANGAKAAAHGAAATLAATTRP